MAEFRSNTDRCSKLGEAVSTISYSVVDGKWQDNSIHGIIKAIEWPSFPKAAKHAAGTMAVSAFIGICLYLYGFAINQLLAYLMI